MMSAVSIPLVPGGGVTTLRSGRPSRGERRRSGENDRPREGDWSVTGESAFSVSDANHTLMDSAVPLDLLWEREPATHPPAARHQALLRHGDPEYLDVSPKAVIDHLRKLDEAGLVESTTDDQRRKYFRIAQSLRLEVSVSVRLRREERRLSREEQLRHGVTVSASFDRDPRRLRVVERFGRPRRRVRPAPGPRPRTRWPSGGYKGASRTPWRRSTNVSAPSRTAAFSRRCSTRWWSRPTAHPRRSPTRSAPARRRWRTPSTSSPTRRGGRRPRRLR